MLRKGQSFPLNGHDWLVVYVTPSRAHCRSTQKNTVTVIDRKSGQPRSFVATSTSTLDISPNTEPTLLRELAQKGHL